MTTAAIRSPRIRTVGRLGCWLSVRHSLRADAVGALTLSGLYQLARGLVGADTADADGHAHRVVVLERSLHLSVEANVQRDATRVSTELGEGDTASTNPPALEVLLAGAEGATFLALVSRGQVFQKEVASCNSIR